MPDYKSVSQGVEVNSIPEDLKYIKNSWVLHYLIKPFSTRAAWLATIVISVGAIIPLLGKLFLNLIDGVTNHSSFLEAGKNVLALLAIPFICLGAGIACVLPANLTGRVARAVVLPIISLQWKENIQAAIKHFPPERMQPVTGLNGIVIDSVDFPMQEDDALNLQYRINFNAAGEIYQILSNQDLSNRTCHTRAFNYPGTTLNNSPGSSIDFVNAGIAEVYDLAKKMQWTNDALEKKLHLYCYCFGGAVGLEVAVYFREKHGVNLRVFVDRSFTSYSDAMAGVIHRNSGVPLILAKGLAQSFLHAGGGLDLDSMAAIKKLDSNNIYHINIGSHATACDQNAAKLKKFLGIGAVADPDSILLDEVTLTAGLARAQIECGQCTHEIFKKLNIIPIHPHLVYSSTNRGHFEYISDLSLEKGSELNARDYYQTFINLTSLSEEKAENKRTLNANSG